MGTVAIIFDIPKLVGPQSTIFSLKISYATTDGKEKPFYTFFQRAVSHLIKR